MRDRPIRVLPLVGGPAQRGNLHGSRYGDEIREFADARIELSRFGSGLTRPEVLDLAAECLPAHHAYAPDLYEEMESIAAASGLTPAEAVVLGGYTDFIDTVRAHAASGPMADNCTAVLVPDERADGAGFLAQTWDMDITATPHVVMLRIEPDDGPAALVFSTVGCLGQIGMNEAGISVGINNLTAADGKIGVTWPFVVRKALQQQDLAAAVQCVMEADLAGGHNYLLFDRQGRGVSIEAMPSTRQIIPLADSALVHTNHCLTEAAQGVEGDRLAHLQDSSVRRLDEAAEMLDVASVDVPALMQLLRHESSICRRPAPPENYESCGAAIMRPATGEFWACWGIPADNEFEHFSTAAIRT
ncbi:MAG TPA: C45 family peptidase [Acidimicrobiia bacterium]|nr:C45 family peptidase [Acidimicrobiia bacterium]